MRSRLPAAAALAAIPAAAALDGGLLRRTQSGIRPRRRLDWKELRQDEPTGECSCSPMAYTFRLDASNDCATDDLDGRPGIGNALCVQESGTNPFENAGVPYDDIEVTSITFLEFDPSVASALNVDDRYAATSLGNGDAFAFDSISKELDPLVPFEEQMEYVPGGVQLLLTGRATVDGEEREVTNRVTWSYTNACDIAPLEGGERIGWVTLVAVEPASGAFCKATATTTTTVAATSATTSSSQAATTEEPIETTEMPIETTEMPDTSVATSTSTTTEATAIVTTTEAPSFEDACVCSPRSYTMKLNLWYLCNEDDLESNDGIGLTLCVVLDGETDEDDSRRLATTLSQQQLDQVEIYDIQILEFGAQGELTVISQEDLQVSLMNGDSFSFDSISADLNADLPLGEQADLVPGGVQLTMRGRVDVTTEDGSVEERTINQRVTWSYTNSCEGTLPVTDGDTIGWVTFESLEDPASDFCPIAPATSTTTTSTTIVYVTSEPTAKPTAKPTPYPTPEMSMVAKSAKSKSSKDSVAFAHAKTGKATYVDGDGKKSKAAKMFKGSSGKSGKHASGKSEKEGGGSGWGGNGGTSATDGRAKRLFPKKHHRLAG